MTAVVERRADQRVAAERRAERIRLTATSFMEARDKMSSLLAEAQREGDHETMGYRSWTEYIAALFSDTPLMRLSRDERKVIVADLAEQGMSSRAIAPVVGASQRTVSNDLSEQSCSDAPRTVKSIDGVERTFQPRPAPEPVTVDHETGEIAQAKPKRKPITDTARDIGLDLNALTDRIDRLMSDDRFDRNRDDIAARLRHHIATATATLNALDSKIN